MKTNMFSILALIFLIIICLTSCAEDEFDFSREYNTNLTKVRTDIDYFRDANNRYVYFKGVNCGANVKLPLEEDNVVSKGQTVSYVGKPFPISEADQHFALLKKYGFNCIRYLISWEGIEPDGSAVYDNASYDTAYLDYIDQFVAKAEEHGIYVLLDMHQDLFSRHLHVKYNSNFFVEIMELLSGNFLNANMIGLFLGANDKIQGDGAPEWAVQACLPEKDVNGDGWGTFRLIHLQTGGKVNETSDFWPMAFWGINGALSIDMQRCFACMFAGKVAFPELYVDTPSGNIQIQDYLQNSYFAAWGEVASRVCDNENVIGYDLMNEPITFFLVLTLFAAIFNLDIDFDSSNDMYTLLDAVPDLQDLVSGYGLEDTLIGILDMLILIGYFPVFDDYDADTSGDLDDDEYAVMVEEWGMKYADFGGLLGTNFGFDANYLTPFYEGATQEIVKYDPDAIIWLEKSMNMESVLGMDGLGGQWSSYLGRPASAPEIVFAPHWYPDIYAFPNLGKGASGDSERCFTVEEIEYRDYSDNIYSTLSLSEQNLGNCPTVLGEFGTNWHFCGIDASRANNYAVSMEILDNYFEVLEPGFINNMIWCYAPNVTYEHGEGWNEEDFSVIDVPTGVVGEPRGETAWCRPCPRSLSGKPVTMHFYSPLHEWDPQEGVPNPEREFYLEMQSKESEAPTEIYIPELVHYQDGFFVWVTDGNCIYDYENYILYWYPTNDTPGENHEMLIRPPYDDRESYDEDFGEWNYFFKEDVAMRK